jgi:hypothetical protein
MAAERKAKADLKTFLAANEVNLAIKEAAREQQRKARAASPTDPDEHAVHTRIAVSEADGTRLRYAASWQTHIHVSAHQSAIESMDRIGVR